MISRIIGIARKSASLFSVHAALLILAGFALNSKPAFASSKDLVIGGSGIDAPVVEALARAYEKKVKRLNIKIISSVESKGGLAGLNDDRIQIAMVARKLAPAEKSADMEIVPYAKTCLVFAVSPTVISTVTNVTSEDLVHIFDGSKKLWPDQKPINVIFRPRGESSSALLISKIPQLAPIFEMGWIKDIWRAEFLEKLNVELLEKIIFSFGWANQSYLAASHTNVRILSFNGVPPNAATATSGAYSLVQELSFVYKTPASDEIENFIAFVKSNAGAEILRGYEAIPIR
jgi:ABC-type phosphate transport system substrate-binding protein